LPFVTWLHLTCTPPSITCRVFFCLQQSSGSGQRVFSFGSIFSCPLPKWQILNPPGWWLIGMAHSATLGPQKKKRSWVHQTGVGAILGYFSFFLKRTSGSVVSYYYYYYYCYLKNLWVRFCIFIFILKREPRLRIIFSFFQAWGFLGIWVFFFDKGWV